ncbi:deoxyribonuclease I [Pseudomonas syringae pv. pisi str. 1704B]|uniref:Deoxyribonuclease I n=1 Tax=Pseudomonas syringae pv. pisi str. 1704B TaxID=629263 RepID=F3GFZ1_PSESJ|nr:deoxyribonuclease I [Pseudomonas syringae pv. pisi str. 1704B]
MFQAMEADLFNLYPSVGEVNGDRSNFNYGMASGVAPQYGQCKTKVDFDQRAAEPRDEVKGLVARTTFYMFDRYNLNMSRQQQQLLMAWDKQFPVTSWELVRNKRIAAIMGHSNPFVTGQRAWITGYKPVGDGVVSTLPPRITTSSSDVPQAAGSASTGTIVGNKKQPHLSPASRLSELRQRVCEESGCFWIRVRGSGGGLSEGRKLQMRFRH